MIGHTIGKYTVTDRIGRGGMGTVYRAIDDTLHRDVAIKVLNAGLSDPEIARRFRAEAITVARLSHPGIATVYELFEHDGQWLMVMEFVRGVTLESLIDKTGALSAERAAELCLHALAALAHAHNLGVVHRDLKPANLMLTEAGVVKVMDFGIARVSGTDHLTNAGFMIGTPAYMAPEQVLGRKIDARADLYAMGVVFYRLVSGALPFKGDSPFALAQSQVNDPPTPVSFVRGSLPPWVDQVVMRALAKNPQERFQSAAAFHDALSRCLSGREPTASFDPSAPTEVMVTPPYALSSATIKPLTASLPSALGGDTVPILSSSARAAAAAASTAAAAKVEAFHRSNRFVQYGAIAIVVLTVAGAWIWNLVGKPDPVSPTGVTAGTGALAPAPSPTSPSPAASGTAAASSPQIPTPTPPPVQPPASSAAPDRGTGGRATNTAGATTPAGATPSGSTRRGSAPPELQLFPGLKWITIGANSKGQENDVALTFAAGHVNLTPKSGGNPVQSMAFSTIKRATYAHADNPVFDRNLPSPPDLADYPNSRAKHWLVLQSQKGFLIIRLETAPQQVLTAFEAASRLKILYATPPK